MHKSNEISQELINSWKSGWHDYISLPEKDNQPVLELAKTCARILKVEFDTEPGFLRTMKALKNIAAFCSEQKDWRDKNLYTINQCIQTIMQQMQAAKKTDREANFEAELAERSYKNSVIQREKIEREMQKESEKVKKTVESSWNEDLEAGYQAWRKSVQPGKVITMNLSEDLSINKAL